VIDFTSGANPLGPSNKAKNVIRSRVRLVSEVHTQEVKRLKGYIAKKERIDEACILFGCGSTTILNTILELVTPKNILTPYPVSQRYNAILSWHGVKRVTIPLRADENFDLAIDDFCSAMHGCDAALLPNPHNITGTVISPEEIIKIADEADRFGINLFIDESYGEYTGMLSPAVHISNSNRAMILRTFSTFHALGGLRLGYVIGPPGLINKIETRVNPSWINSFAPWAAIASMKDEGYRRRTLLFIENEKAYIRDKVSQIKNVQCCMSPINMLVIRLQKEHNDVKKWFEKHKILIHIFGDEDGNTYIRFPTQTHRLNAFFVRILKRMMEE
jgi:threonine-phosphate decarboxylase